MVFGHKLRFTGGAELFDALETINAKYDIDVFLGGHLHYYARYWPMCGTTALTHGQTVGVITDPGWITQIVSAAVGSAEDLTAAISHPDGVVSSTAKHYGIGLLRAANATHLRWEWSTEFISNYSNSGADDGHREAAGAFSDRFWLVKNRHGPRATRACQPRSQRQLPLRRHDYETCLVDGDGATRRESCSVEQTERTLGEH